MRGFSRGGLPEPRPFPPFLQGLKENLFYFGCDDSLLLRGLSLVAQSGFLAAEHGPWRSGSVVMAPGRRSSAAPGIFPDQGSNPCLLHWQADPQTLNHQGSLFCRVLLALNPALWAFGGKRLVSQCWKVGKHLALLVGTPHLRCQPRGLRVGFCCPLRSPGEGER